MEMRNQPERRFDIRMRHVEGFRFVTQASEDHRSHGEPYYSDEPDPVGANSGPATPALLATAVAHCLSASLLETSRKAHLEVLEMQTSATAVVVPNEAGNPRIQRIEVRISPLLAQDSARRRRCEDVFQNYCTVSSSLKPAIAIDVKVDWRVTQAAVTSRQDVVEGSA